MYTSNLSYTGFWELLLQVTYSGMALFKISIKLQKKSHFLTPP